MTHLEQVPLPAAIVVGIFLIIGSLLTLVGALGLVRMPTFYDRMHGPALITSWGTAGILLASIFLFSITGTRIVVHELFLGIMVMVTTPATWVILGRAAIHRDRAENSPLLREKGLYDESSADEVTPRPTTEDSITPK